MAFDWCGHTIECKWMLKRCTPPGLTIEQCCTGRTFSYYPLKHGYQLMLSYGFIWMNVKNMHTTKTDYGTIYSEAQMRPSPHEYEW